MKGTFLDTEKTRSQLQRIAKVLAGAFGAVGRDVRLSILAMFGEINSALNSGGAKGGNLTKRRITETSRGQSASAFGLIFQQPVAAAAGAGAGPLHVHVMLDNHEIGDAFISEAQLRNRHVVSSRGGRAGGRRLF